MLSGRYRTDRLARHWSKTNPSGCCTLPGCTGKEIGDLLYCPALEVARSNLICLWSKFLDRRRYLHPLICSQEKSFMQLLLDPSTIPSVILSNRANCDTLARCLYLSRTWVHSVHLKRKKLQKLYIIYTSLTKFPYRQRRHLTKRAQYQ